MDTPDRLQFREEGHPLRDEQRAHIRAEVEGRLRHRKVEVEDGDSDDDVLAILNAVERFESTVTAAGGDLMVDTPESSLPEHGGLVLPLREGGESATAYAARLHAAADRLARAD